MCVPLWVFYTPPSKRFGGPSSTGTAKHIATTNGKLKKVTPCALPVTSSFDVLSVFSRKSSLRRDNVPVSTERSIMFDVGGKAFLITIW